MREEDWLKLAVYIWLSAYFVFFVVACILLAKRPSMPRWLIFIGTFMLLLFNLAAFAEFADITNIQYHPMYEDPTFAGMGIGQFYPEWQRLYWWACTTLDFFGKIIAGIGLIIEARRHMTAYRFKEMQKFQPPSEILNPNTPTP